MIIVTGAAGFIGSNLLGALNRAGCDDILVVDDLTKGEKFRNLAPRRLRDYWDKDDFLEHVQWGMDFADNVECVFHLGACSDTTEWDGRYMMNANYQYSKHVFEYCLERSIPFIYASSAAVYGASATFQEAPGCEAPLNVYGYSKLLFDQYVRRRLPQASSQVAGLRYFNVYGPGEAHKGSMASVVFHFDRQLQAHGTMRLFRGSHGYGDGEQRRDFVYVDDAVMVKLWLLENSDVSGIFNVGTGRSQTFNDVAAAISRWHGRGEVCYIDFPEHLSAAYQAFTEADLTALRGAGYAGDFRDVAAGVRDYLTAVNASPGGAETLLSSISV